MGGTAIPGRTRWWGISPGGRGYGHDHLGHSPTDRGDVVDLILEDHRLFEALLRALRDVTAEKVRQDLGAAWLAMPNRLLDEDAGRIDHVRAVVARAHREGLLPAEDEEK